jgi:predicted nucleotidyltransferase
MTVSPPTLQVSLPLEIIEDFCRRWRISRLEVFGSALREDFRADSDLDLIATFAAQARWSLLDRVHMKHELEDLLGRKVDLLNRRALENPRSNRRAREILAQTQLLYAE